MGRGADVKESASGLAQSKSWRRIGQFMGSLNAILGAHWGRERRVGQGAWLWSQTQPQQMKVFKRAAAGALHPAAARSRDERGSPRDQTNLRGISARMLVAYGDCSSTTR